MLGFVFIDSIEGARPLATRVRCACDEFTGILSERGLDCQVVVQPILELSLELLTLSVCRAG